MICRYRAFISYSQKDKAWGARLHRWLEDYRLPEGVHANVDTTRRLGRFFRDDDEMPATPDIAAHVRRSLDESDNLIVICSPRSARSRWVAAEIQYFRRISRGHKIFAFIIDGEPNSGDPRTECFPFPFRGAADPENPDLLSPEPLGLDVRKDGRERACARLAAGLLEIDFDYLWQRDRRRAAARQRWWIGGLSTATVTFAGLAAAAVRFGLSARRSSRRADAARASLLADTSTRFLEEGNIAEALGYASAALEIAQSDGVGAVAMARAERATRQALIAHHTVRVRLAVTYREHEGRVTDVATSADGRLLATAGDDGIARLYERGTGVLLKEVKHQAAVVSILFFDGDRYLLSAAKDGQIKATSVDETGCSFATSLGAYLLGMRATPAGDAVLAWGLSGKVALWHLFGDRLDEFTQEKTGAILNAEFLPGDPDMVFLDHGVSGRLIALRERDWLHRFSGTIAGRDAEQALISFINNDEFEVFDLRGRRVVCKFETRGILSSVVDGHTDRVVALGLRLLEFRSLSTGAQLSTHEVPWVARGIVKASVGNRLVAWGSDAVRVFRLDDGQPVFDINPRFKVIDAAVSDQAGRLLLWGNEGSAGVWSLDEGTELRFIEGRAVIREARFGEDGRSVWLGRDPGQLQVVALEDGAIDGRFFHGDTILGWKISTEASEFLTWSADGTAKRWSWLPGGVGYAFHPGSLRADKIVVNSEAGVAFSSRADNFSAWRLDDGNPIVQGSLGVKIVNFVLSNDGKGVFLLGLKRVCAWNIVSGEHTWRDTDASYRVLAYGHSSFALHDKEAGKVASVDTSRVSEWLVDIAENVADVSVAGETKALVVSRANGEIDIYTGDGRNAATTLDIGRELAYCVGSQQDNRIVAVATDGALTVFDLDDVLALTPDVWLPPVSIPMDQLRQYNPLQLERHIFFAGSAGRLIWLDPVSRSVVRDETTADVLNLLRLSDDRQRIAAISDQNNLVLLFDRAGGEPVRLEHRSNILGLHFLAGGRKIATWSADRMLKVWKVSGALELELPHFGIVDGVTATPEGDLLVSWTDKRNLAYWDLGTGAKLFETSVADKVREVKFLQSPERMIVVFEHAGPTSLPYVSRERLIDVAADLLAFLRPFSQSELRDSQEAGVKGDPGFGGARKGSTSKLAGRNLLSGWEGAIELGHLADGGLLLVSDRPFDDIIQMVEYNEFDQLLSFYAFNGSMTTMALPIPPDILDAMRRQKLIIVYSLFPDHEPIGYSVPLTRQ